MIRIIQTNSQVDTVSIENTGFFAFIEYRVFFSFPFPVNQKIVSMPDLWDQGILSVFFDKIPVIDQSLYVLIQR